jgi:ABC-2 type transport system ATP-binding protein
MRPVTDSKPPALLVQGLSKTYGDGFTAVAGLDLEIPDGAFFGLLGPNGEGKATLIGSVCNLVRPITGTLTVFGHDHRSRAARRLLGLAEQEINVDRFLSIRQILIYHAGYHGIGRKAAVRRVDELLEVFRLDSKATARAYELSGVCSGVTFSRGRSCTVPACSSSTSRPPASSCARRSGDSSRASTRRAPPSC